MAAYLNIVKRLGRSCRVITDKSANVVITGNCIIRKLGIGYHRILTAVILSYKTAACAFRVIVYALYADVFSRLDLRIPDRELRILLATMSICQFADKTACISTPNINIFNSNIIGIKNSCIIGITDDSACGDVQRIKGFVKTNEGRWIQINAVPGKSEIMERKRGQEALIIIGENLNKKAIDKYFEDKARYHGEL